MKDKYLEITFRKGKVVAAYLYLTRDTKGASTHTKKEKEEIIIDFNRSGEVIGIEITAPAKVSITEINEILEYYHLSPLTPQEFAPLLKAA